jgi:hypothetical protein
MSVIKLSTNFAVFLLFFGVAVLESFQTQNWIKAAFWLAIGTVFLVADNLKYLLERPAASHTDVVL